MVRSTLLQGDGISHHQPQKPPNCSLGMQIRALFVSASCYFKRILLTFWVLRPPSDPVLNPGYFLNLFQTLPSMKCKRGLSLASFIVRNI